MRTRRRWLGGRAGALVVAWITASSGCDRPPEGRELVVSAASSLTDAFADVERAFEAAHPDVDVLLNLGGTASLRTQILEGAPVDVFASADTANMAVVSRAGRVAGDVRIFARNVLRVAVPAGNPRRVRGLEDLADPSLRVGLCAVGVPCGDLARRALARAGIEASLDTGEPDVRALLTKIELGELDVGVTYATDVAAAHGAVEGIDLPPSSRLETEYPIAVLTSGAHPDVARSFVAYVLSDEGRSILATHGFLLP